MEKINLNNQNVNNFHYGFRKAFIKNTNFALEARFLLILLMTYKGKNTNCWPSQGELGRVMNRSRDSVRKYLTILEEAGHLKVKSRGIGRSLLYEPSYWGIYAGTKEKHNKEGKPAEIPRLQPTESFRDRSISLGNKEEKINKNHSGIELLRRTVAKLDTSYGIKREVRKHE